MSIPILRIKDKNGRVGSIIAIKGDRGLPGDGLGRHTEEGGEIFNDYENNKALSKHSTVLGENNIAGLRGFAVFAIDVDAKTYTLDSVDGLAVDDVFSVIMNEDVVDAGKITAIDTENNIVITDIFAGDSLTTDSTNYFFIKAKPEVGTQDIGVCAYAQGENNKALFPYSHAEGAFNEALGHYSHAEGRQNIASGKNSHVEGRYNKAIGSTSHSEGLYTVAKGHQSHAEGRECEANGDYSHAEGSISKAIGAVSHAEGCETKAQGHFSHAEGLQTKALKDHSHAEGLGSIASGNRSHAENSNTEASGDAAHAEGHGTKASGSASHSEGYQTTAQGTYSHTEGLNSLADGYYSHAEGGDTTASGWGAHAEGCNTTASGWGTHAEGSDTVAFGKGAHAGGIGTKTSQAGQRAIGLYNDNKTDTLFEIGNGTSDTDRKNAFEVYEDGHAEVQTMGESGNSIATRAFALGLIAFGTEDIDSADIPDGAVLYIQYEK